MKRRLTVMLLAVFVCITGAYQMDLYPASGQTATPSPSPGALGSISGRVYVDVNANNTFESPDVGLPTLLAISAPPGASVVAADDGTYTFSDLPAGGYTVGIILVVSTCARTAPFRWTGEPVNGGCDFNHYTTLTANVDLVAGENRKGVDLPQLPETLMTGRAWLDAQPLPSTVPVAVTVDGHPCWNASTSLNTSPAGVAYTTYSARLESLDDIQCQV
jgi:hypothetical protein